MIKCPNCGTENDVNIKVCKCGFKFENLDKALALCEQAELSIEMLEFDIAQAHLNDVKRYWKECSKVAIISQKLEEYKVRVGVEVKKCEKQ